MSTTTNTSPGVATSTSLASSVTFRTFATVFAIAAPVIYTICEMRNWPLFTYHPGTNRVDLFWAAAVKDEGPAIVLVRLDSHDTDRSGGVGAAGHQAAGRHSQENSAVFDLDHVAGGGSGPDLCAAVLLAMVANATFEPVAGLR